MGSNCTSWWLAGVLAIVLAGPAAAQPAEYRIGANDVLRITVFGHDDLSRSATVGPDGTLQFPLVGSIPAAGLTAREVEARLRELLGRDYLVDPQVSVSVQEYRSQRVFVLGEVEKPGAYSLTGRVTLVDILAQAGGPSKAAGRQIHVIRGGTPDRPSAPGTSGGPTLRIALKRLLEGDAAENVVLQSGDTIFIPKTTSVFVLGEVVRPGAYSLEKDTTPLEAVTLAGGLTETAASTGARLLRRRDDGSQETIELDLTAADSRARELLLAEGDTLLIPRGTTYFVSGEVRKPGAYPLGRTVTAFSAVTTAGGFTDRAASGQVKLIRRSGSQEETLVLDLSGADPRARDLPLRDGDTLLVPSGNAFYVLGEVRKPGAYQIGTGTTALGAVTMAGGFTEKASQTQVKLTRKLPTGEDQVTTLDLSGGDARAREFPIRDGDILIVAVGNTFYVLGEVGKPGAYQIGTGTTAAGAVTMAGGFTEKANQAQVKLTRRLSSGEEQVTVLDLSGGDARAREFLLKDGDILLVPIGNTFYVLGEVKKPGAYQLTQHTTAIQAIAMAGGFTEKAAPGRTRIIRTHRDGRQETFQIDLNDVIKRGARDRDPSLTANDVIVVPESFF